MYNHVEDKCLQKRRLKCREKQRLGIFKKGKRERKRERKEEREREEKEKEKEKKKRKTKRVLAAPKSRDSVVPKTKLQPCPL